MSDDDHADEMGHGLKPARGVMFGLLFSFVVFVLIGFGCGLYLLR